ncbi:hypothetical protein [Thiocapsa sp.]|uniref:hypothetical protein n=1 Tax=Thiocapsa sp. TaxID=2024551 RepID=UPI00262DEFF6|nr:hypothetical protein [Thiocapsa sp.]
MSDESLSELSVPQARRGGFRFPSAVTTLVIVTVLVWVAALFIPPGQYATDADGSPIPGTYERIDSPSPSASGSSSWCLRRSTASMGC